jgi:hypothetical protein
MGVKPDRIADDRDAVPRAVDADGRSEHAGVGTDPDPEDARDPVVADQRVVVLAVEVDAGRGGEMALVQAVGGGPDLVVLDDRADGVE